MFTQYDRTEKAELRPITKREESVGIKSMSDQEISVSAEDLINGSPKVGDMIARNPKNHKDQWLVAKQYFEDNFKEIK